MSSANLSLAPDRRAVQAARSQELPWDHPAAAHMVKKILSEFDLKSVTRKKDLKYRSNFTGP